jgi:MFS family permease
MEQTIQMQQTSTKLKGSTIVFILTGLLSAVVMIPYLGPATILPNLMTDLGIPTTAVGYVISIYLILCGICMYIGSFIQSKLGYNVAMATGVIANAIGILITAIAPNFIIFMIGRGISGFGYGVAMVSFMTIQSMWFQGNRFAAVNSFNSIASCIGISIAYAITAPLMTSLGDWRGVFWAYFAMSAVYALLCIIFVKVPASMVDMIKAQREAMKAGTVPKHKGVLTRPFKFKNYWMQLIHNVIYMSVNTAFLTYLTLYFTKEAGISLAIATLVGSVFSLAQIVGALLGGILTARTGRRKPIVITGALVYGLCMMLLVLSGGNIALIFIAAFAAGTAGYLRMPAQAMYLVEETGMYDQDLVGPAASMINGLPMLANLALSPLIALMVMGSMGYGMSFIILGVINLIGAIPLFIASEVGAYDNRNRE